MRGATSSSSPTARLQTFAGRLKVELTALSLAIWNTRTPWAAQIVVELALA